MSEEQVELKFKVVNLFVIIPVFFIITFMIYLLTVRFNVMIRLFFLVMIGVQLGLFFYCSKVMYVNIGVKKNKLVSIMLGRKKKLININSVKIKYFTLFNNKGCFLFLNNIIYIIDIPEVYSNPTPNKELKEQSKKAIGMFQKAIDSI